MKGKVLFFNVSKGLGFVTAEGSEERYFVHESKIRMEGFRALLPGMPVEFEIGSGPDGRPQAWNVTPTDFKGFAVGNTKPLNPETGGVVPLVIRDGNPCVANREPSVSADTFSAYLSGGRVNGYRFELPRYDGKIVYLVLDPQMKEPVIVDSGRYEFMPTGSYLVKAEADRDEDGDRMHVTVFNLGRRHQVQDGKNLNWAEVERRFEYCYDLTKPMSEQETPTTPGLDRDNDGFVPAIEVLRQFLNA